MQNKGITLIVQVSTHRFPTICTHKLGKLENQESGISPEFLESVFLILSDWSTTPMIIPDDYMSFDYTPKIIRGLPKSAENP